MTLPQTSISFSEQRVRHFLKSVVQHFDKHPFSPHPLLKGGHAQTLAAYAWPRRFRLRAPDDETRLFQVAPDTHVLAHCRWQPNRGEHPTVVMWHGIEGSSLSLIHISEPTRLLSISYAVF